MEIKDTSAIIIIPTHSNYIDVCRDFLNLFKKNWGDCPYEICVSITGSNLSIEDVKTFYNGTDASLIDCILNVSKQNKADYYFCFLGDAFINGKINTDKMINMLDCFKLMQIDYCSLLYVKPYAKKKIFIDKNFRYISNKDRYSHNFVSFVASEKYIFEKLATMKDDYDFEYSYLKKAENIDTYYFEHEIIVNSNIISIYPGIVNGRWNRKVYNLLVRDNPELEFTNRRKLSLVESFYVNLYDSIIHFLSSSFRNKIKRVANLIINERSKNKKIGK